MRVSPPLRALSLTVFTAASLAVACGKKSEPPAPVVAPQPATEATAAATTEAKAPAATTEALAPAPEAAPAPTEAVAPASEDAVTALPVRAPDPEKQAKRDAKVTSGKGAGRFVLDWRAPRQRKLRPLAKRIAESAIFPELVGVLNDVFIIPKDIHIRFENCEEINAFYDAEERLISLCWELIEDTAENFARENEDPEEAFVGTINATLFTFFHELGHALIHVLDLPITGREEDAVDQLATWLILLADNDEGELMALDGATSFRHDAEAEAESDEAPELWGEHSLNEQRFFNIVCWVYGHNPRGLGALTEEEEGPLPGDRAEQCEEEWTRLSTSWERLLAEHVVED